MEFAVPIAVLGIVLAMIAPLPPFLLDVLISANITMSVFISPSRWISASFPPPCY
jgi:flagellar biosynthesis protein FlhA